MKNTLYLFLSILLFSGCEKLIEVDKPVDQITNDLVFENDASANLAINGLYIKMMAGNWTFFNGAMSIYSGLSADDIINTLPGADDEFSLNSISPNNGTVQSNFWSTAYAHIYHANAILEGVSQATHLGQALRDQLIGEASLLRAMFYFYLVNIFGDVPLVLTTNYAENARMSRTAAQLVYDQIETDVNAAVALLPDNSPSGDNTRPTKLVAKAFLARLELYRGNWDKAVQASSEVINSGAWRLEPDLNAVFGAASPETLWQLLPVSAPYTWDGYLFVPIAGNVPNYVLHPALLASFDSLDLRKQNWTQEILVGTDSYICPYKYRAYFSGGPAENYIVLRLAEQYLIRSEAYAKMENRTTAETDLNIIRARAGLAPVSTSSTSELLDSIMNENRREFFAEWGHRWLDLKRTGRIDAVLSAVKPGWKPTAALFPIPQIEIQRNSLLEQNPGY